MQVLKSESLKSIRANQKKRYEAYLEKAKQMKESRTKEGK